MSGQRGWKGGGIQEAVSVTHMAESHHVCPNPVSKG
jgi:hypothetical protein